MPDDTQPDVSATQKNGGKPPPVPPSLSPTVAARYGAGLIALGLAAFLVATIMMGSTFSNSLGFGALAGVVLTSLTLVGLIVLIQAAGLGDGNEALGLPKGSVRALLAFALALIFVAVSSWTLGGMNNFVSVNASAEKVFSGQVTSEKLNDIYQHYPNDKFVVFAEAAAQPDQYSVKVLPREDTQSVRDLAKQIITITSTVLVTVVGFYFGSKGSSDAAKTASDAVQAVTTSIVAAQKASPDDNAQPRASTADDARKNAAAISTMSSGVKAKLELLGDKPLDQIRLAAQDSSAPQNAKDALNLAEKSYQIMQDRVASCATCASQAQQAIAAADGLTDGNLAATNAKIQNLLDLATQASHDFEQAFGDFLQARVTLFAPLAK